MSAPERILYVVGARPNFVKMAPVIAALRHRLPDARHTLVHTGQHYDRMMSSAFFEDLDVPEPNHLLGVGSGSHAVQTARVMERIEPILEQERPELVIVPGDVNSTLAAALVAAKLEIKLAHVESGLRSFDRSMPEEINRVLTDNLAEHLFIHSQEAAHNLHLEGVPEEQIHFVGNTMIDSLVAFEHRFRGLSACRSYGVDPGQYLLVTLHRPALVDGPELPEVMEGLGTLATDMPVLFPVHPRTKQRLGDDGPPPGVQLVDPVAYHEFLSLEVDAAGVLTDSGGVQEETTYLGVPCFTLRDNTERPVTLRLGTNTLLGLQPARITEIPSLLEERDHEAREVPPGWDGHAAARLADVIADGRGSPSETDRAASATG